MYYRFLPFYACELYFAEAELVKAASQLSIITIDFTPKRLASLHFCTIFLTCHSSVNEVDELMV